MAETKGDKAEDKKQPNATAEYLGLDDARNFAVEGNDLSGYIGVSPEYMTYADETQKPLSTDEEVVPRVEQLMFEEEEGGDSKGSGETSDPEPENKPKPATTPAAKTAGPSKTTPASK